MLLNLAGVWNSASVNYTDVDTQDFSGLHIFFGEKGFCDVQAQGHTHSGPRLYLPTDGRLAAWSLSQKPTIISKDRTYAIRLYDKIYCLWYMLLVATCRAHITFQRLYILRLRDPTDISSLTDNKYQSGRGSNLQPPKSLCNFSQGAARLLFSGCLGSPKLLIHTFLFEIVWRIVDTGNVVS